MSSLSFILGPASKDHQNALVKDLYQQLKEHPNDQFFFLVPNHIKFSTEIAVLHQLRSMGPKGDIYAQSRVQILSFSRLAWFLLRDTSEYQKTRISKAGLTMLVAKIVRQLSTDDLRMFAKEVQKTGFVQDLCDQLIEFQNANISPDDHDQIMKRAEEWALKNHQNITDSFRNKLTVLFKVYRQFDQAIMNHLTTTAIYQQLVNQLNKKDFSHTHFYLNRFTSQFSAMEEQVVEAIIKNAAKTTIGLVLDRPYRGSSLPDSNDLFYQTGLQYHRLIQFAQDQEDIELAADRFAENSRVNTDLDFVEKWMADQAKFVTPDPVTKGIQNVHFFTAPTRIDELNRVAAIIRQMVATGNYRYRDFLVLTRRLDGYSTMLKPVFEANQVPAFNDNDQTMANDPLVTLIDGLFKISKRFYQLADVLQLLKTGLVVPAEQDKQGHTIYPAKRFIRAIHITENWCLKYGKTGGSWLSQQRWEYTPHISQEILANNPELAKREEQRTSAINWVKDFISDQVAPVTTKLTAATDGTTAARALYEGLVQLGVDHQLSHWVKEATDNGDLNLAQEPQQVWRVLCSLLDEYVQILGTQKTFSLDEFQELLQVGFSTATYSRIPSTMDQVLISETGITQTNDRKVIFMIGSTDDVMPEVSVNDGLLSDPDRQILNGGLSANQYLPVSGPAQVENESLLNYLGMLSATQKLYFSAPDMGGEDELRLSPYLIGLAKYFNKWDSDNQTFTENLPFCPESRTDFSGIKPFISSPTATLTNYIQTERTAKNNGQTVGTGWRAVSRELNHDQLGWLKSSLTYQNKTTNLKPALASQLYGHLDPDVANQAALAKREHQEFDWTSVTTDQHHNTLATSISQLQTFYRNPYEYFLKFGLGLQKRDELEITNASSGTFYHDTMEEFIRLVSATGIKLRDVADDQLAVFVSQAMDWAFSRQPELLELAENYQRIAYQKRHLESVALTMARVLRNQARYSKARTLTTEQQFGNPGILDDRNDSQRPWRPLVYETTIPNTKSTLPDLKRKVYLRGRIDRVDTLKSSDSGLPTDFLTVVDYKSSNKQFDLVDAYEGIDLQMLSYLNNLRANLDIANPGVPTSIAGAVYLHLYDPKYSYSDVIKKSPELLELQNHRFKGILMDDDDLLRVLDTGLGNDKPDSRVLDLRYVKTKNQFKSLKGSLLVNREQLNKLLDRNKKLITNATQRILSGDVELRPYRRNQQTGLQYSDYQDIYHFDNVLDQDKYNDITLTEQDILDQLKNNTKGDKENG